MISISINQKTYNKSEVIALPARYALSTMHRAPWHNQSRARYSMTSQIHVEPPSSQALPLAVWRRRTRAAPARGCTKIHDVIAHVTQNKGNPAEDANPEWR